MKNYFKIGTIFIIAMLLLIPSVKATTDLPDLFTAFSQLESDSLSDSYKDIKREIEHHKQIIDNIQITQAEYTKEYNKMLKLITDDTNNKIKKINVKLKKANKKEDKIKMKYEIKLLKQEKIIKIAELNESRSLKESNFHTKIILENAKINELDEKFRAQTDTFKRVHSLLNYYESKGN